MNTRRLDWNFEGSKYFQYFVCNYSVISCSTIDNALCKYSTLVLYLLSRANFSQSTAELAFLTNCLLYVFYVSFQSIGPSVDRKNWQESYCVSCHPYMCCKPVWPSCFLVLMAVHKSYLGQFRFCCWHWLCRNIPACCIQPHANGYMYSEKWVV